MADAQHAAAQEGHADHEADKSRSAKMTVDKEGFLSKQSMWLKDWRNRYFRLVGNQLHFSKTPEDAPHGVIDLSQCLTVKSANDKTGKSFSFEVATPDQVYFMCATDEATKDDWIGAIGRAIVRYSASYTKNTGPGPQVAIEQDDDVSSDDE